MMFIYQSDFTRIILIYIGLSQTTNIFTEAIQEDYDKCLLLRTISFLNVPSKWDPFLAAYRQINDSEFKHLRNNMGKRSLSTLAKNDDMPATHFQDGHDDGDSSDSSRYDEVDKKVLNKVVKYLQHVKRRNNQQKIQNKDINFSNDNTIKETIDPLLYKLKNANNDNDRSNVKILTEDYIVCNTGNSGDRFVDNYENLRMINELLRQADINCDHNEVLNNKDEISLVFNCIIKRFPLYDPKSNDKFINLKEKFQDADFLSIILNSFNNEQAMQMLKSFYPRVDKRFMGRIPEMGPRFTTPPTRRHGR